MGKTAIEDTTSLRSGLALVPSAWRSLRSSHRPRIRVRINLTETCGSSSLSARQPEPTTMKAATGMKVSRKLETLLDPSRLWRWRRPSSCSSRVGGRFGIVHEPPRRRPSAMPSDRHGLVLVLDAVVMAALNLATCAAGPEDRARPDSCPRDLAKAAGVQAKRAGEFIDRVSDPQRRERLARELSQIQAERPQNSARWTWSSSAPSRPARLADQRPAGPRGGRDRGRHGHDPPRRTPHL